MKFGLGDDGVGRWSEQRIWDDALRGVRIVISTHAVLAEALAHRFVAMAKLALVVFDKAHHCFKHHPANCIMEDLYHPTKNEQGPESVPRILGLTASPIVRTKLHDIPQIERNLNAVCRAPRAQQQGLMKYVHPPQLILLRYAGYPQQVALYPGVQMVVPFEDGEVKVSASYSLGKSQSADTSPDDEDSWGHFEGKDA